MTDRFETRDDLDVYSSDNDVIADIVCQITDVVCNELRDDGDDTEFENDLIKDAMYTLAYSVENIYVSKCRRRLTVFMSIPVGILVVISLMFASGSPIRINDIDTSASIVVMLVILLSAIVMCVISVINIGITIVITKLRKTNDVHTPHEDFIPRRIK